MTFFDRNEYYTFRAFVMCLSELIRSYSLTTDSNPIFFYSNCARRKAPIKKNYQNKLLNSYSVYGSGLPDHCIYRAKSSLVSSSKQRKQKANTKKNKEHC